MEGRSHPDLAQFREDTYPRLKKATHAYFSLLQRKRTWMPPGLTPDDVIHEAVARTLDGKRIWDPQRCTQFQHFWGCVTSIVSCAINEYHNQHSVSIDAGAVVHIEKQTPEEDLIYRQELAEITAHLTSMDPLLLKLFKLIYFSRVVSDDEIAKCLKLGVSDVRNAKKKLKRALLSFSFKQKRHRIGDI